MYVGLTVNEALPKFRIVTLRYTQSRKVPGSNLTDALGQALGPNVITMLPVTFG